MAQYVESGSSLTLSAGESAGPIFVQGGGQLIVSGGLASQTTVQNMGNATAIGGGIMNTVNASGGLVNVLSGGQAINAVLTNDAYMNVRAGSGTNIRVVDGILSVSSGGYVSGVQIAAEGSLKMIGNGIASGITVSAGGTVGNFKQINGVVSIAAMNGNTITGAVTGLNAVGNISAATGANISGGTFASGSLLLSGNAAVAGLTLGNSGILKASSGSTVISGTKIAAGGALQLNGNANAYNITIYAGGTLNSFKHIGSTSAYVAAISGSAITSSASNIVFEGTMNAGNGAKLSNITVNDGVLFLSSGAFANNVNVLKGSAFLQGGASADRITVTDGGYLRIAKNATVTNLTLSAGAKALGFTQLGATPATIELLTTDGIGGVINNLAVTGNVDILTSGTTQFIATKVNSLTVAEGGKASLSSAATIAAATIQSDGTLAIKSGAIAQNATVAAGGHLNIASGGTATAVTWNRNGYLDMVIGGGDTKTYLTGKNESGTFSYINGVATGFVVYAGQNLVISSGGSARNLTIAKDGVLSAAMGADVSGYSSDMKMSFSILGSAISGLTNLSNFELAVGYGYAVDGQKLHNGGVQTVASGGLVNETSISSGGEVRVGYNGSAWDLIQSEGGKISLDVYHSAALTSVTGSRLAAGGFTTFSLANGTASNFLISSGASMTLHSGGSAIEATIADGGKLLLSSGGIANKITLEKGAIVSASVYGKDSATVFTAKYGDVDISMKNGLATNFVLENGGRLNVYSGGVASGVTLYDGGTLYVDYLGSASTLNIENGGNAFVENEGRISNVEIGNGGELTLSAGAVLSGTLVVSGLLSLEGSIAFLGKTITIDVTDKFSASTAKIENISFISDASYAVTVNAASTGNYVLATGALNFSDEILIYDQNSNYLGTISKDNNFLQSGDFNYSIREKDNGDLVLDVENASNVSGLFFTTGKFNGIGGAFEWTADGRGTIHNANALTAVSGSLAQTQWALLGAGDFDGDGNDGLLWFEKATGDTYIQNDLSSFSEVTDKVNYFGTIENGYQNIAAGDFTGSGLSGLLVKGPITADSPDYISHDLVVWGTDADGAVFNNGSLGKLVNTWQDGKALAGDPSNSAEINAKNYLFDVAAVGDFNGDGIDDVIIQNMMPAAVGDTTVTGSGDAFTFLTGSAAEIKAGDAAPTVKYAGNLESGWQIMGAGDFNGDGTDDILLTDGTSVMAWKMVNGQRTADFTFHNLSEIQEIAGIADLNGDGTDDILIRNSVTSELSGWTVKDGQISGTLAIA